MHRISLWSKGVESALGNWLHNEEEEEEDEIQNHNETNKMSVKDLDSEMDMSVALRRKGVDNDEVEGAS